jgi:hypothetical protein
MFFGPHQKKTSGKSFVYFFSWVQHSKPPPFHGFERFFRQKKKNGGGGTSADLEIVAEIKANVLDEHYLNVPRLPCKFTNLLVIVLDTDGEDEAHSEIEQVADRGGQTHNFGDNFMVDGLR